MNASTGKEIWHVDNPAIKASNPVVTDNKVIVSRGNVTNNQQYGLSIYESRAETFQKNTTSGQLNYASPIVAGDVAYFGTFAEEGIFAVNINTGDTVWNYKPAKVGADNWH